MRMSWALMRPSLSPLPHIRLTCTGRGLSTAVMARSFMVEVMVGSFFVRGGSGGPSS